ncbi:hypothetical protein D9M68_209010 [compost metagenome]
MSGGLQGGLQGLGGGFIVGGQVAQPLFQPAPATAAPLRPADPAAQFGRLLPRQTGGEGAVGGVEQVVALVEDDALQRRRLAVLLEPPCGARAVEGGLPVPRGGDDQHNIVAGHDRAVTVDGGGGLQREALNRLVADALDLRFGHAWIMFELKRSERARLISAKPGESDDRADVRTSGRELRDLRIEIEVLALNAHVHRRVHGLSRPSWAETGRSHGRRQSAPCGRHVPG